MGGTCPAGHGVGWGKVCDALGGLPSLPPVLLWGGGCPGGDAEGSLEGDSAGGAVLCCAVQPPWRCCRGLVQPVRVGGDAGGEGGCPEHRVVPMGVWLPPPPSRRCPPRWVITHSSPVALISACRREGGGSFLVYSCPPFPNHPSRGSRLAAEGMPGRGRSPTLHPDCTHPNPPCPALGGRTRILGGAKAGLGGGRGCGGPSPTRPPPVPAVVIEDDRIDEVLKGMTEKSPPGV